MNQGLIRFFGIVFYAFGLLPCANADFTRSGPVDAPLLNHLVGQLQRIAAPGKYKGITESGTPCQVQLDYSSDSGQPYVTIASGAKLTLRPSFGGEVTYFLFGNTDPEKDNRVQFIGEVDRQESPASALFVNVAGESGVLSSVQFGFPNGTHGGGRPFQPGDVISLTQIALLPACNGLIAD